MTITTLYKIPAPLCSGDRTVEVYGEPANAWYEWRIIDGGRIVQDTGTEAAGAFQGRQYGQAEVALRDALMVSSGLDDPYVMEMRRIEWEERGG